MAYPFPQPAAQYNSANGPVLYAEGALKPSMLPEGPSYSSAPLLPPFTASPYVLKARPGFFLPAKGLDPARNYMRDYWRQQDDQMQKQLRCSMNPLSPACMPYYDRPGPQDYRQPHQAENYLPLQPEYCLRPNDPAAQMHHQIALDAVRGGDPNAHRAGVWLYSNCKDCLTRGCLSPDCPNSGWRASGEGGPRGDAEAAREIAAAAAQGNLLAAAAARKYFSPEDAAFLQDAALRTLQEHGGIHGGAPMAHHYLLEGPHSSPSSAEGAYKSSRDKEKRRKHREKSHSKVAQEHYRLPSEAAEGRGWGTPWGAPVGASGWMTPGGPPAAVKEGSSRHEKRCPREARKRGSSKETGGRSGTAQREFSRQSSSSGEEKWHRPNGHHGRQVGLPFQYHEPMIHKTHNNKKSSDPIIHYLQELESGDLRKIVLRLIDCRRLENQIEGDLHQLSILDSLLLQNEAADAAASQVLGTAGNPPGSLLSNFAGIRKASPSDNRLSELDAALAVGLHRSESPSPMEKPPQPQGNPPNPTTGVSKMPLTNPGVSPPVAKPQAAGALTASKPSLPPLDLKKGGPTPTSPVKSSVPLLKPKAEAGGPLSKPPPLVKPKVDGAGSPTLKPSVPLLKPSVPLLKPMAEVGRGLPAKPPLPVPKPKIELAGSAPKPPLPLVKPGGGSPLSKPALPLLKPKIPPPLSKPLPATKG